MQRNESVQLAERPVLDVWYPESTISDVTSSSLLRFPLILYFPGWPGDAINNRVLIRELVSHGYAVITFTYRARMPTTNEANNRFSRDDINLPMDFSSLPALKRTTDLFERRVRSRGIDADLAIEMLQQQQDSASGPDITRRLDLSRIGVLGFSLGGAIANHLCSTNSSIRSVVDMDASHWVDAPVGSKFCRLLYVSETPLQPAASSALLSGDPLIRGNADMDQHDYERILATLEHFGATEIVVPRTSHMDFTDRVVESPIRRLLHGRIGAGHMVSILNDAVVGFFDATLLAKGRDRFDQLQSRYKNIHVREWVPTMPAKS